MGSAAPANEPAKRVELLTPIPRSARLTWLVEKATEIGVSAIRLLQTERGPRRTGGQRLDRLRRVAVAAVEQSQRSVVPEITGVHPFAEVPGLLESAPERWVLQSGEDSRSDADPEGRAALLVGPEGGWTSDELEVLASADCRRISLGPTVLRIETAAIVGSAMLLTPKALR